MSWKDASYILASKYRRAIILKLDSPKTPTILAKHVDLNLANVSRSLTELEKKGLVICLTPKQRVGKIYSLTKKGKYVIEKIKKMEER
jgi:predicted transcriptional regulator